jgi:sulfur carrier protein
MSISLRVNGETHSLDAFMPVAELLGILNISIDTVVVERNRKIVPKELFSEVILEDGDELEIIRFVGGG